MSDELKDLFASVTASDLLVSPFQPKESLVQITYYVVVLRVGKDGEIYLSNPAVRRHKLSQTTHRQNPFRWDDRKGAVVDRRGDSTHLFSNKTEVVSGGASETAWVYAKIPREEAVSHQLTHLEFHDFKRDPRFDLIAGLCQNGEVATVANQLSLVLDVMDFAHTKEQLAGLLWFIQLGMDNWPEQEIPFTPIKDPFTDIEIEIPKD